MTLVHSGEKDALIPSVQDEKPAANRTGWFIREGDGWVWTDMRLAAVAALTEGLEVVSVQQATAAPDLLAACVALAPFLGATDQNDWSGLQDDDALSMPVKVRVGDLRALKDAIAKATGASQ